MVVQKRTHSGACELSAREAAGQVQMCPLEPGGLGLSPCLGGEGGTLGKLLIFLCLNS